MSTPLINATPATQNSNLPVSSGSPFSPGIPLEAHQPIFGREEAFRFAGGELARYRSVNAIGERRMGKTSLLKHLLGNQQRHINPAPTQPPLVLAHVDIQAESEFMYNNKWQIDFSSFERKIERVLSGNPGNPDAIREAENMRQQLEQAKQRLSRIALALGVGFVLR